MDVTSKAGLMAQPRHQQELYDEPTSEIEFGELLGQLLRRHVAEVGGDKGDGICCVRLFVESPDCLGEGPLKGSAVALRHFHRAIACDE